MPTSVELILTCWVPLGLELLSSGMRTWDATFRPARHGFFHIFMGKKTFKKDHVQVSAIDVALDEKEKTQANLRNFFIGYKFGIIWYMYCGVLFCCSLFNISLDIPLKFLESLVFFRNGGWLIENHGLGLARDSQWQICYESSTGNAPNTPQFIWPICPNLPIIWDTFEKIPLHMSIVHAYVYIASKRRNKMHELKKHSILKWIWIKSLYLDQRKITKQESLYWQLTSHALYYKIPYSTHHQNSTHHCGR